MHEKTCISPIFLVSRLNKHGGDSLLSFLSFSSSLWHFASVFRCFESSFLLRSPANSEPGLSDRWRLRKLHGIATMATPLGILDSSFRFGFLARFLHLAFFVPLHALPALRFSFSLCFFSIFESSFLPGFTVDYDHPLSLTRRSHRELWQRARPIMIRHRKQSQDSRNPVGETRLWLSFLAFSPLGFCIFCLPCLFTCFIPCSAFTCSIACLSLLTLFAYIALFLALHV